ncbi:hypothetical protein [Streptomyces sp. NPDC001381]|uniref:hypothetical protein n=1 Tax=Streptomyces sp. NPDC001381 TaxID=3364567 RepID=UPI00367DB3FF
MSSLKREALAACRKALVELGFRKRGGSLLRDDGEGASGWIGLNVATYGLPASLGVNPVVGVRFDRLDEVMRALRDDLPKEPMPVISRPLGYLMPENSFRLWEFRQGRDVQSVAESMARAVSEYGEPFMKKYSEWVNFSRDLEAPGLLMEHERAKVLPVVRALDGRVEVARGVVADELARISGMSDVYAQSYRAFAEKFLDRFE